MSAKSDKNRKILDKFKGEIYITTKAIEKHYKGIFSCENDDCVHIPLTKFSHDSWDFSATSRDYDEFTSYFVRYADNHEEFACVGFNINKAVISQFGYINDLGL